MSVVSPIHTEAVGLGNIRFFAPPSGQREFPWIALDDAMHAFSVPIGMRRQATQDLQRDWKGEAVRVATEDGILLLIPHYMAQGMAQAMSDCGRAPEDLYWKYAVGGARALTKLIPDLHGQEMMAYLADALAAGAGSAG